MSRKRSSLTIVPEAPQMPQEAADILGQEPTTLADESPHLDELAALAAALRAEKGMTGQERLMVVDGWVLDTLGMLGYLITGLQAGFVGLARTVRQIAGLDEAGLPDVDVEVEARALLLQMAAARIQAEIDYLTSKPAPGGGLIVP